MTSRRTVRALVIAVGTCVAVPLASTGAGAATHPAPLCGAFNMVEASPLYYGSDAVSGGMDIAMSRDTLSGNNGMLGAVAASSTASSPGCTTS